MKRWVSLVILLVVIAATGYLLYQVMAGFLLPLFLAVVLAIIFQPLHNWVLRHCQSRQHLAAVLTTLIILATVLLPFCGVLSLAVHEGLVILRGNVVQHAEARFDRFREKLKLNLPFETLSIGDTKFTIQDLESLLPAAGRTAGPVRDHTRTATGRQPTLRIRRRPGPSGPDRPRSGASHA